MNGFMKKALTLVWELFSPSGRRGRGSFFLIFFFCYLAIGIIGTLLNRNVLFLPAQAFFLQIIIVISYWIILVNVLKRMRDIWFDVLSICFSEWPYLLFMFFAPIVLIIAPSARPKKK